MRHSESVCGVPGHRCIVHRLRGLYRCRYHRTPSDGRKSSLNCANQQAVLVGSQPAWRCSLTRAVASKRTVQQPYETRHTSLPDARPLVRLLGRRPLAYRTVSRDKRL